MNNDDFTILFSGGSRCCWVSMCTVWPSHSRWLSGESNKSASNFVKLEHSSTDTIWMIQKATGTGYWWLAMTMCHLTCHILCSFFEKHQITQVTQLPYSSELAPCDFWLFPKLKLPLKEKRFQTIEEIRENKTELLIAIGRTVWGPKVPTLKETEASLSLCTIFLISYTLFNKYLYFSYYQ